MSVRPERRAGPAGLLGDGELGRRVATAVVGAVLVVAAVFGLPVEGIVAVAGAVALGGAWEWARLGGLAGTGARVAYLLAPAAVGAAAWLVAPPAAVPLLLGAATLFWIAALAWLLAGGAPRQVSPAPRPGWLILGLLVFPAMALAAGSLAAPGPAGRWLLLYAIALVWVADIGAYFAGRALGRRKLAPRVSGGKTWAGLVGGLVLVALYAAAAGIALGVGALLPWVLLAVAAGVISVAGDLVESVLKREAGAKDSGRLLPGHGGLLDRIDSLVAALPLLALGASAMALEGTG